MLEQLLGGDLITQAATIAITGFIGWGASMIKSRFGIEVEARHREALQSALLNGAKLAIGKGLTGPAAVAIAVDYARTSVPDAVKVLKPKLNKLDEIAEAKIQEITGMNINLPLDNLVTKDALQEALDKILSQHRS